MVDYIRLPIVVIQGAIIVLMLERQFKLDVQDAVWDNYHAITVIAQDTESSVQLL